MRHLLALAHHEAVVRGVALHDGRGRDLLSSKQRDPNSNKSSLIRKQCCKRRMESLICRCFLAYSESILRVTPNPHNNITPTKIA